MCGLNGGEFHTDALSSHEGDTETSGKRSPSNRFSASHTFDECDCIFHSSVTPLCGLSASVLSRQALRETGTSAITDADPWLP